VILGSTGSIGVQALEIIARNPDQFTVVGLCATGANAQALARAALEFDVEVIGVTLGTCAQDVQMHLFAGAQERGFSQGEHRLPELVIGPDAPEQLARMDVKSMLRVNAATGGREGQSDLVKQFLLAVPEEVEPRDRRACERAFFFVWWNF
jgi:1-deoxy-D-xylulose-5-phosphate reductoisomerase